MEKSLSHGTRADLSPLAVGTIILLTLLWGFNYVTIKVSNEAISPVFASAVRSVIASICGILYCKRTRQKLFHKDVMLVHGMVVGLLFGLEFACIYFGLLYTDAARSVVFVYLSPFIVAAGAHFFLKGDRLTLLKVFGLVLAFGGMVTVFQGKPKGSGASMLFGDILQIMAAFLWAATTLYIKKFMATKIHPINTFLYQLVFSIPILFAVSLILEPQWVSTFTLKAGVSLFYQSVIVAFASYFVWFKLIHDFPVSRLSSFTFFTPVFGVLFGVLFMGEELTVSLMVGLPLVCVGILFVNWKKGN
ncbi:MAG: EamA/RhaT family transporter [Deltaproteobacteria bacterium HGW-Deltaproteobacteria-21]|nr:MAG: EamA/RhaT family transporter [Deltaproteobacteria bacterium HGW-Deltaproteobacteria-21]